jgi:hypothetical protein
MILDGRYKNYEKALLENLDYRRTSLCKTVGKQILQKPQNIQYVCLKSKWIQGNQKFIKINMHILRYFRNYQ